MAASLLCLPFSPEAGRPGEGAVPAGEIVIARVVEAGEAAEAAAVAEVPDQLLVLSVVRNNNEGNKNKPKKQLTQKTRRLASCKPSNYERFFRSCCCC